MSLDRAITPTDIGHLSQQESPSQRKWRDYAGCRGMDVSLFYGYEGEPNVDRIAREKTVKAICDVCPVSQECLEEGIRNREWGVWGGLSQHQRRRYVRRERKIVRRTERVVALMATVPETILRSEVLASRKGWDGTTVVIRFDVVDESDSGFRWCLLKDQQVKYVTSDESDAWLMFGSWTVTL